jgi:hypothetical protein
MTYCFGYMPGTYKGPYPTAEQAQSALSNASTITVDNIENGRLTLNGEVVSLEDGPDILARIPVRGGFDVAPTSKPRAAIWKERCLLLYLPNSDPSSDAPSGMTVAIDCATGRPFAYYLGLNPASNP